MYSRSTRLLILLPAIAILMLTSIQLRTYFLYSSLNETTSESVEELDLEELETKFLIANSLEFDFGISSFLLSLQNTERILDITVATHLHLRGPPIV